MPSNNPLNGYSAITDNTKIQFKAGTQTALNAMITGGGAIEGAFYLTTDTHKLYVGRKRTSDNKIYPEQVSRGVTVVGTSTELPTPTAGAPAGAIEEGELFYITDTNVLAALKYNSTWNNGEGRYEWVQINPPTGITDIATATVSDGNNNVDVRTVMTTQAGDQTGGFKVTAGDNITLGAGTGTVSIGSGNKTGQGNLTISATDTTYQAAVETNTSKGVIGLKSKTSGSFGSTLDSAKIDIEGTNSVKVTSDSTTGKVTVAGPNFTGVAIENSLTDGFAVTLSGTKGDGTALGATGSFTPHIKYGATTGYSEPSSAVSFNQNTEVGFANGVATLNVYTKAQADQAITDAINGKLATANAMTYMGTITSGNASGDSTSLWELVSTNGAHNGDTYKVSAVSATSPITIGGQTAKVGDLIIISGSEGADGTIAIPNDNLNGLLGLCDLVPAGDEPEFVGTPIISATRDSASGFQVSDGKVANSNLLTTKFISGNKIDITSALDNLDSTNKTANITVSHSTTTRTDSTTETLAVDSTSATDTIGTSKLKLFVLSGETTSSKVNGIQTDDYGHVTGVEGKIITFQHNYVDGITVEYNASNGNIGLTANNKISGFNSNSASLLKFASDTLQIKGNVDTNNHANDSLKIDLVWGTFN